MVVNGYTEEFLVEWKQYDLTILPSISPPLIIIPPLIHLGAPSNSVLSTFFPLIVHSQSILILTYFPLTIK